MEGHVASHLIRALVVAVDPIVTGVQYCNSVKFVNASFNRFNSCNVITTFHNQ